MNNKLDDNPFAEMLVSGAREMKRMIFKKLLPFLIIGMIGSFLLGFLLGAIIF